MSPTSSIEMMAGDLRIKPLPRLPFSIEYPVTFEHDGKILLCGTGDKKCYQLDVKGHSWREHSILNQCRPSGSAISTTTATFLFGGDFSPHSFEYLPKGSITWQIGKSKIPKGFSHGCAINFQSANEIWLIGGFMTGRRILKFSIENHTFEILPLELNMGRWGHQSLLIPNAQKVLITGGRMDGKDLNSTEILDLNDKAIEIASSMNYKRTCHGMGLINVDDKQRIASFGGSNDEQGCLDSVEFYDPFTNKWETSSQATLREAKANFGYITIKWANL